MYFGEALGIEIELETKGETNIIVVVGITTSSGFVVCDLVSLHGGLERCKVNNGDKIIVTVPDNRLNPGKYVGGLWIGDQYNKRLDYLKNCFGFEIIDTHASAQERYRLKCAGTVFQPSTWQLIHKN